MSTDVRLSKDARQCILEAITYWIDNITQEETNKEDYLHMIRLQKRFLELCPWIGPPGESGPNDGEEDECAE